MVAFGKASGGGRRRSVRDSGTLWVTLTTIAQTYEAVLADISATGARVQGTSLPSLGEELYLTAAGVKTFCKVRWQREGECGLQFFEPLLQREATNIRREVAAGACVAPAFKAALDDWVLGIAR